MPKRTFGRHIVIALSMPPSVRPSISASVPLPVRCISHIFFEFRNTKLVVWIYIEIENCHLTILGHYDFTSDLVFRMIESRIYLIYYLR